MSEDQETARSRDEGLDFRMIRWLGFFLLVFAVAGFAFYLAGDLGQIGEIGG